MTLTTYVKIKLIGESIIRQLRITKKETLHAIITQSNSIAINTNLHKHLNDKMKNLLTLLLTKELERIWAVGVKSRRRRANNISVKCETSLFTETRLHVSSHF